MAGARHSWWDDRRVLAALAILLSLPLWWPSVPPLTDLPGHIGRFAVQLDGGSSADLARHYGFEWRLIGNLGLDLMVVPLAPLVGLERAVKLIVLVIPALAAWGLIAVAREAHGRVPPTVFFALPLVLGHPFTFGFVNFSLSMALALNVFALWLRLGRQGRLRLRVCVAVPLSVLVWLAHGFGWGVLGLMAFAAETERLSNRAGVAARFGRAALHCLPLALPALLMLLWRSGATEGGTGDWFNMVAKLQWLVLSFRDRWQLLDIASLGVLLGVLAVAWRSPRLGFDRTLGLAALMLFAVYVLLPRILLSSAYADMRLIPYALAIAIVAVRAPDDIRWLRGLAIAGLAFLALRVGATTVSFALHHQRHSAALEAIDRIPRGARIAAFVGTHCALAWHTPRLDHIAALAIVRRHAFSNDQWALAGAQLLTIRKADAPGFVEDPAQLVTDNACTRPDRRTIDRALAEVPHAAFDYIWLLDPPAFDPRGLQGLDRVWANGADSLYRVRASATQP
jgi:hypothetical protein